MSLWASVSVTVCCVPEPLAYSLSLTHTHTHAQHTTHNTHTLLRWAVAQAVYNMCTPATYSLHFDSTKHSAASLSKHDTVRHGKAIRTCSAFESRQAEAHTHTQTHTDTQTHRHTDTHAHRHRHTHTQTHSQNVVTSEVALPSCCFMRWLPCTFITTSRHSDSTFSRT